MIMVIWRGGVVAWWQIWPDDARGLLWMNGHGKSVQVS